MKTFTFEGDVDGVDAATIAFDKAHITITIDIVVPGSIAITRQLLNAEPTIDILPPYTASMANTRTTKCRLGAYLPFDLM
jgi:hypothetical protein